MAEPARLVPADAALLGAIVPGARERACVARPAFDTDAGPAWAYVEDGRVLGAGGARINGQFAGLWLWLSDEGRARPRLLFRAARTFLLGLEMELGVTVMRAAAVANDAAAARFLRHLDFEFCGIDPDHGDTGLPAAIYERRLA